MRIILLALLLSACAPSEAEIVDECRDLTEQAVADSWAACEAFFTWVIVPSLEDQIEELRDFIAQECSPQ